MSGHGGGFSTSLYRRSTTLRDGTISDHQALLPAASTGVRSPVGFRNFIRDAKGWEQFKIKGRDPRDSSQLKELQLLMYKLALRFNSDYPWPDAADAAHQPWENPNLPSGYTYLLQLVAHDLVHSSLPLSIMAEGQIGIRNDRDSPLTLDTLYGAGPLVIPFAYARDPGGSRTKLRLGRIGKSTTDPTRSCPFRDIARSPIEDFTGVASTECSEVLIADPRNDDNPILAQMTALFHLLHNGIVDLLQQKLPAASGHPDSDAAHKLFACARGAVTLIYRNVVRKDLLRRILHPGVRDIYVKLLGDFLKAETDKERFHAKSKFLDHDTVGHSRKAGPDRPLKEFSDWKAPREFAFAAFRFGHAMIRPEYVINDLPHAKFLIERTLGQTSEKTPGEMPLNRNWIAKWSRFFGNGASNLGRRIGPQFSDGVLNARQFEAIGDLRVGSPEMKLDTSGLAYRDLLSSSLVGLWSVDALIKEIKEQPEGARLIALSKDFLDNCDARKNAIEAWLCMKRDIDSNMVAGVFTPDDIASLSENPPLLFFILFEAAHTQKGLTLGVLGSIIVAEVVFGAIARSPLSAELGTSGLAAALEKLSREIYGTNHLTDVPEVENMQQLVECVARLNPSLTDGKTDEPDFL